MASDSGEIQIGPATSSQRADALLLLLSDYPPAERTEHGAAILSAARSGVVSLDQLFVASRGNQVKGVVWANTVPGRMAAMWPPRFRDDQKSNDSLAASLIAAAEASLLQSSAVALWQTSLPVNDVRTQQRLSAVGYRPLATLVHLNAQLPVALESAASALELIPYEPQSDAHFRQLLESTYVGSLDCPELDNLRTTEDCLNGYRAIGDTSHQHWYIARHQGIDAGCLLLARHSRQQFELVYMGLATDFRGMRLGPALCGQALQIAAAQSARQIFTAVDARNAPALHVYRNAGFEETDQRLIMVKRVGTAHSL